MTDADETLEDEYNEFDEFDDEDDEGGLSGFAVLLIGMLMFGAFISVTWVAYQQGVKRGPGDGSTPYVAADPEPIKIETADAGEEVDNREVYDVFDGENEDPTTVLAEGPEEPVDRAPNDPIAEIVADAGEATGEAVDDRIASLEEEDAVNLDTTPANDPVPEPATTPTPASTTPDTSSGNGLPIVRAASDALAGSHVVQIGAFRSDAEAMAQWGRIQTKVGDYVDGKSPDVERADLGERGVYHRLRIGPFNSADAAKDYCVGLKERGQDCLIKAL